MKGGGKERGSGGKGSGEIAGKRGGIKKRKRKMTKK